MKNQIKAALLAVVVAATSAQAATYNGDLILGFTTKSGNDLMVDIGSASSLFSGETWNLGASGLNLLGALNTSTVNWGVIGSGYAAGGPANTTKSSGLPITLSPTRNNNQDIAVGAIYSLFGTAGVGQYAAVSTGLANNWNNQTTGSGSTTYKTYYQNPNKVGYGSTSFYSSVGNNTAATLLGTFSFADTGIVTYNAVPEPATYGALAGAGLLIVSLRNQFRRKQA